MKVKLLDNCTVEELDEEVVIAVEKDGILDISKTLVLEGVAVDIWKYIKDGKEVTVTSLVNELKNIYDVDVNTLKQDVNDFLLELRAYGVVTIDGNSNGE